MDRGTAVDALAERCRTAPGTVFVELLARLRARAAMLASVLEDDPLRFEVSAIGTELQGERITFTAHGSVVVVNDRALAGQAFRPDVVISDTPRRMLVALLDDGPGIDASVSTAPGVAVERVRDVLVVVAEELLAMATADS